MNRKHAHMLPHTYNLINHLCELLQNAHDQNMTF